MRITDAIYRQSTMKLLLNSYTGKSSSTSKPSASAKSEQYSSGKNPSIYRCGITGYPWIDNFTFKRDSKGPLTADEEAWVEGVKFSMLAKQQWYDTHGINERAEPPLDEDGYPLNAFTMDAQIKRQARVEMDSRINSLLSDNGIFLSIDEKFELSVDSGGGITISGLADTIKAEKIQNVLSESGIVSDLVRNIKNSTQTFDAAYTKPELTKYNTESLFVKYTGYKINDLNFTDAGIFTNDGVDFWSIFSEGLDKSYLGDADVLKKGIKSDLQYLQSFGIKNIKDISLKIGYEYGGLADIGTKYGYGNQQTGWITEMMSLRGDISSLHQFGVNAGFTTPVTRWAPRVIDFRA